MQGCFSINVKVPWDAVRKYDLVVYIGYIFSVLTMALRKESGNVRYFLTNVTYASITEAVRNLGRFGLDVDLVSQEEDYSKDHNVLYFNPMVEFLQI